MKYIPDLVFETDEQNLSEFYNSLYLDCERHNHLFHSHSRHVDSSGIYSLNDLEQMLKNKGYPQIRGAREILEKFIGIKQMILCSGMEHQGTAF